MTDNIFKDFQTEKEKVIRTAAEARELGWINADAEKKIVDKINSDILTIGVIGQMNCGKSTFLNSFIFGADVLPTDNTAMTAAITVITYGAEPKLLIEFYTRDEWEQLSLSHQHYSSVAPELITLLGTEKEEKIEALRDYAGAGGRFNIITKSVTIYYPLEYLRGVEIVDTPGFNDPNEIREERTRRFLNKADVVLLLLYAGKPFDEKDRDILFDYVRNCGIGKVLIGINKYDIPYGDGESVEEILNYVTDSLQEQAALTGDRVMMELIKETTPIPFSAEMALMSQLPPAFISEHEHFKAAWERACDDFEITTPAQMLRCSNIDLISEAVRRVIERDKIEVLLRKPANAIRAAALNVKESLELQLLETETLIATLKQPDNDLEEKMERISRAETLILREIDTLDNDMELSFHKIIRSGRREMEEMVDDSCQRMKRMVDNMSRLENFDDIRLKIESEYNTLILRRLRNVFSNISEQANETFYRLLGEFCANTENTLVRYLDDFDPRHFISSMKRKVSYDVEVNGLFNSEKNGQETSEKTFLRTVTEAITKFLTAYFNNIKGGYDFITDNRLPKRELLEVIEKTRTSFNADKFLNTIIERKTQITDYVRTCFIEDLVQPLQLQAQNIQNSVLTKENSLKEAEKRADTLRKEIEKTQREITIRF